MSKLIHIGGAQGIGKTTILTELKAAELKCVTIVFASRRIRDFCRDNFGKEPWQVTAKEVAIASREIIGQALRNSTPFTVFDSHYIDIQPDGSVQRLVLPECVQIFSSYLIVEAPPIDVLNLLDCKS